MGHELCDGHVGYVFWGREVQRARVSGSAAVGVTTRVGGFAVKLQFFFFVVVVVFVMSDDHVAVASAQFGEPFVLDVDVFYLKDFFQKIFQHQEQKDQASSRRRDAGDLRAPDKRNARRDIILRSTKIDSCLCALFYL